MIVLKITVNGIAFLLMKIKFVVTMEFHGDRTDGEFGIYQQVDWRNLSCFSQASIA